MQVLIRYEGKQSLFHPLFEHFLDAEPGAPGRCPACGTFGYITGVDVIRAVQAQRCRPCGYAWELEFKDSGRILEVRGSAPIVEAPAVPAATAVSGDEVIDLRTPRTGDVGAGHRIRVWRRERPLEARPAAAAS